MSEYPEHDKLSNVLDQSQAIGEFLEWMGTGDVHRMRWRDDLVDSRSCPMCGHTNHPGQKYSNVTPAEQGSWSECTTCGGRGWVDVTREGWVADERSITTVLAEYFEIDQDKLEAEKRQMLEALRAGH